MPLSPGFVARSVALVLAAGMAGLTCDDAPPAAPLAEQLAKAFCAHQFNCCSPYEMALLTSGRYANQDQCVPFATLSARQQLGAVDGALATGRITVDDSRLDACMKAYAEQVCNTSTMYPSMVNGAPDIATALASCPDLLVGHVPATHACSLSMECAKGSRCVTGVPPANAGYPGLPASVSLTPSEGVCVAYQQPGQPCNDANDCDEDHTCRSPDFVCGTPAPQGAPCTSTVNQMTGQVTSECDAKAGLYCEDIVTRTCRHHPRADEPCDLIRPPLCDPDPALGLSCVATPFSTICRTAGNEGDDCGAPAIAPCRPDLVCHPTQADGIGTCGALPQLGDACRDRCASPGVCVRGSCTMPGNAPLGATCSTDGDCASLSCTVIATGRAICTANTIFPLCVGAGVTIGNISGLGGMGGTGGLGGTFVTGRAGNGVGGAGGRAGGFAGSVGTMTGTAGFGGGAGGAAGMPALGCPFGTIAPENPIISDFTIPDGTTVLPIGGLFTYTSPLSMDGPAATITGGALHVTAATIGRDVAQFWGAGIFFNGDASGTLCIDASKSRGVQFDISGTVEGLGCTLQYATTDSAHLDSTVDPKGSGPPGAFAPQAGLSVTPTPATVMMPFNGPGGGSPPIPIDSARLTGVQWQLTTAAGTDNTCAVDLTIDNVRFF
jgi:hypothetical protein